MKKIISKLFGRQAVRSKKSVVQVVTSDGVEHYRWAKLPLILNTAMFTPVSSAEDLDFLSEQGFDQIDLVATNQYCVYSTADDYRAHYISSPFPLDIFCEKMSPVFSDDLGRLTDVVSIKKLECQTFCYKGKLYDLSYNDAELQVIRHHDY